VPFVLAPIALMDPVPVGGVLTTLWLEYLSVTPPHRRSKIGRRHASGASSYTSWR
jgi:hypothetical protein